MRNRFAGHCLSCMRWVPVGEGHPQKAKSVLGIKWRVKCVSCVERDRSKVSTPSSGVYDE